MKDDDESNPKSRVIRKDGVWMAVRGMWKRSCSSHAEAVRQASILAAKKMCLYDKCLRPSIKGDRYQLGLCSFHARKAAKILHLDPGALEAA